MLTLPGWPQSCPSMNPAKASSTLQCVMATMLQILSVLRKALDTATLQASALPFSQKCTHNNRVCLQRSKLWTDQIW